MAPRPASPLCAGKSRHRCPVACVSVEYSMIIRVRSCLVSLSGALALGAALLGLPLASGSDRAFAEDIATATCLVPDDLLAISVEAAEEFDVRCHIAGAETPAVTAEAAAAGQ